MKARCFVVFFFPFCTALRFEHCTYPYSDPVQTGIGEVTYVPLAQFLAWLLLHRKAAYFMKLFNP